MNLGKLVGTLYGAELFFVVVVFGSVATIARIPCGASSPTRRSRS